MTKAQNSANKRVHNIEIEHKDNEAGAINVEFSFMPQMAVQVGNKLCQQIGIPSAHGPNMFG